MVKKVIFWISVFWLNLYPAAFSHDGPFHTHHDLKRHIETHLLQQEFSAAEEGFMNHFTVHANEIFLHLGTEEALRTAGSSNAETGRRMTDLPVCLHVSS